MLPGHSQALRIDIQIAGHYQGRNIVLKEAGEALCSLFCGHALQHFCLRHADNLETTFIKVVKKAHQLKTRAVDVADTHQGILKVFSFIYDG